jgi:hypothetical protein
MTDLLKLFDHDPQISAAMNLLACAIAFAWLARLTGERRTGFVLARRGWLLFWIATSVHYLVTTFDPNCTAGYGGFYVATAALLAAWDPSKREAAWPSRRWMIASVALVLAAAIVDRTAPACRGEDFGAHQLLTAVAIGMWAWRAREVDIPSSLTIAGYAIFQLPVHQLLVSVGSVPSMSYPDFVARTYLAYAALKLIVLPSLCTMLADKPRPSDHGAARPTA